VFLHGTATGSRLTDGDGVGAAVVLLVALGDWLTVIVPVEVTLSDADAD